MRANWAIRRKRPGADGRQQLRLGADGRLRCATCLCSAGMPGCAKKLAGMVCSVRLSVKEAAIRARRLYEAGAPGCSARPTSWASTLRCVAAA